MYLVNHCIQENQTVQRLPYDDALSTGPLWSLLFLKIKCIFFLNWKIFGECPALLKHGDKIEYSVILEGLLELEMPRTQVTEDSVLLKATWEQEQLHRRLTQEDHLSPGVSV